MGAIYEKEFKSYFNSVLGYAYCAVMIIFIGIYFLANNLISGYPYFSYAIRNAATVMMFVMPIITMRSFAEENKNKTDQMLLTSPVKIWQIVLGKFLAMATVYAIPLLVSCLCPLFIKLKGTYSYMKVDYLTILYLFLYGLVFIAIGMFISSLTENMIIAAVASFAVVFLMIMWSNLVSLIPSSAMASLIGLLIILVLLCILIYAMTKNAMATGIVGAAGFIVLMITYFVNSTAIMNFMPDMLSCLDLSTPFNNVAYYNIFDVGGLVMYLSGIFIFLMFTVQVINKRRWN